ncbi:CerR family C-terminal domain-containing protein [Microbulbifer litoralis]|uniref:CerR family C-terminal domain-containing protein n=1 Tax=Microbulbifer litoralis TaxID=2933965 RepID=UPI002028B1C5|nr:CerR family C-terminal domain-containing protein [Microbulbifer sp. GX H0434]
MSEKERFEDEAAGKLIYAGMQLFGEYGFKGATTRMIASEAESNIGSIAYYFGNKKSLYLAIVNHIAERMKESFKLDDVLKLEQKEKSGIDQRQANHILKKIIKNMIQTFIADDEASSWLLLIMREQANPTEAFDILYNKVFDSIYISIGDLISVLMGLDKSDVRVTLEAHSLIGQVVFFLTGRTSLLRRMDGVIEGSYSKEDISLIEEVITSRIECYMKEDSLIS